jgi:hypothetical protein
MLECFFYHLIHAPFAAGWRPGSGEDRSENEQPGQQSYPGCLQTIGVKISCYNSTTIASYGLKLPSAAGLS